MAVGTLEGVVDSYTVQPVEVVDIVQPVEVVGSHMVLLEGGSLQLKLVTDHNKSMDSRSN